MSQVVDGVEIFSTEEVADVMARWAAADPEVQRLRALPYSEYLRTGHWEVERSAAVECQGCCQLCGSRDRLQAHHWTYVMRGVPVFERTTLTVLCRRHHAAYHGLSS